MNYIITQVLRAISLVSLLLLGACSGGSSPAPAAPGSDASLSSLAVSIGVLSPAFDPATLTYAVSVNNATASVTVTPTAASATATIKVNNVTVVSGAASAAIPLAVGANPIDVVVTAQDGTTTRTYALTVTRQVPPDSDASLAGLAVSAGALSPAFAAATTAYTDLVPMSSASVDITATTTSAYATMTVNGVATTSGTAKTISLPVGQSTITIDVTAQDGVTNQTYTITVTRPAITLTPAVSNITVMNSATMTVTLAAASGTDTVVTLSSSDTSAVTVPASVTVLAGDTQAIFSATSIALGAASSTITATLGADAPTATVNVSGDCVTANDCPGTDTVCQARTCTSNTCGFSYVAAGTPAGSQSAGDCHQNQCDGAGNISNEIDDTDVYVDGNSCTSDLCVAGVPSNPNEADGTSCVLSNSLAACTAGTCTISSCSAGFGNCNNLAADGCESSTVADVNNCGTCGHVCASNNTCANSACACVPGTCAAMGANCGFVGNGCGNLMNCGTCSAPQTCGGGGAYKCGTGICTPLTCASQGANCGAIGDGCGGTLNCGVCPSGQYCGGGGWNKCGS